MSKLNETEFKAYLKQIRELAEGPFEEIQKEVEVTNKFPKEFFKLAIENNLYRCCLPVKYGGWGLNELEILQVQEEFSRGPGGMRMHLHYAADMNWRILDDFGNKELKDEYMNKFADKTIFTCFALTEETGGTGADLHTMAVKDGDDYILNGEKTLISHTDCCEFAYVIAVTNPTAPKDKRLSAFFVPVNTPGYETVPMPHMMGCRGAGHAGLRFTNMRLNKKYLLGKEGDGLKIAMHSLSVSRAHIAVSNLGMAQRMLEMSIARAKDRVTFGKPLIKRQAIQQTIADMGTEIYALRMMVYDFAKDYEEGKDIEMKAAMCKLHSINTVKLVSDYCLEIFGGIGYFEDNPYGPVERLYRDCRAMWLEEGPRTVQRLTVSRKLIASGGVID
ncbi:acyl-CoA dehydrogenase family protein [Clostridium saccharobutylicum]|uniref:Acyl-CoA dehydrogenase MmgC n=1 Tax=Clostridium saccharobutylicum DSM 13864 TaxID=1345695 RepID=U5MRJ6_CLOSA|nr:acyl-CoA dehydrogenase family protein [Clostridium saccharobutylicum]AGX43235.1 acyl-CoA dehydrogenase MmgC [Clostridium saccharobutylicum DSM 13864]AQR90536.1 acyl-CoA dehydrogenase [Clostridium saccharobutylicum]AQS00440.1 acyl-CoA dehydrogenase [Clostridium saccharobutylicum]AQS10089.1 acyl-CoA dehydrogenase [Clostridium saccharobutylicum]AQS14423.1 acyl-CoA dehydrogenase [Clostridium saccharobutylicum]